MTRRTFKEFLLLKEADGSKDWKTDSLGPPLAKGFIPPLNLRPIIRAFIASDKIVLMGDTGAKPVTMPKKALYLVGGCVRDFIKGKTPKDLDLATNATPEQIALILSSAGFKRAGDRSGREGTPLHIPSHFENEDGPQEVQDAKQGDNRVWFIKGRDNSKDRKPFVISAVVNGEEFEIATFRKDAKVTDGQAAVDFVDNPKDDADRRDLTINSLYIELTSDTGENKKLYDPTKSGLHDLQHSVVKTVGKAEERFEEDPLRVMRAIRFHCRFGSGEELDQDIKKAIPKFLNLHERVALERIRDEFLKGLLHPDIDPKKYLNIYYKTGLLKTVFPGVQFSPGENVPPQFANHQDKILALAWMLQHNPVEKVAQALAPAREVGGEQKPTGWLNEERKGILFLLKLKEFNPDRVSEFMKGREGTGLSNKQIRDWVDLHKIDGTNRDRRPWWSKHVRTFADHQRSASWEDVQKAGRDVCQTCKGKAIEFCPSCRGSGKLPDHERGKAVASLEADRFKEKLSGNAV